MSRLNRLQTISIAVCAGAATLSLAAVSCIKEKDSLVIVGMTADMDIPGPIQVRVSVGPVTQTFDLATGLKAATPTQRGVYLDSKTTGTQVVSASTQGGTPCLIYTAFPQKTVVIDSAGETKTMLLALVHSGTCGGTSDAGAGGTGAGGTGVGGAGGAGIVAPPSLSHCVEIHHSDITCDTTTFAGDALMWSVAFSPDGKLLLTAGDDGRIRFWKIGTGAAAPTVDGRELTVSGASYLAFSHNGQYLAAGDDSGLVTVWTLSNSPTIYTVFNGHGGQLIDSVWFSPDDTHLVSVADDNQLIVWSMATRTSVATVPLTTFPWWVRTSPLGTASALPLVVTQNDGNFVLMNALAPSPVAKLTTMVSNNIDTSHQVAEGVSYSPDGRSLLVGSQDGSLSLWTGIATNQPVRTTPDFIPPDTLGNNQAVKAAVFFPDGAHVASASGTSSNGGRLGIFETTTRRQIGSKIPTYYFLSLDVSPDGAGIAAGEVDCGLVMYCHD